MVGCGSRRFYRFSGAVIRQYRVAVLLSSDRQPPWEHLNLFSIRSETANINDAEGSTLDTQPVYTSLTVRYSIQPDRVAEVYEKYSHNGDLSSYVDTATHEIFKAVTAK
jgi:hypothetical protein